MARMMRLHLVRHPKPQVDAGICYGQSDLDVSPQDIAAIATQLHTSLPGGLPVYSSPLQRCSKLARALQAGELHLDARLAELDFGTWELRAWDDIPREEIDLWSRDLARYCPGGGESLQAMAGRILAFHQSLRRDGLREALVICHAGSIRLLSLCGQGLSAAQMAEQAAAAPHQIGYGECITLEFDA